MDVTDVDEFNGAGEDDLDSRGEDELDDWRSSIGDTLGDNSSNGPPLSLPSEVSSYGNDKQLK